MNRIARESARRNGKRLRWELKLACIAAYGGICRCCGETEPAFLTIDHVENNGAAHRRHLGKIGGKGAGGKFYGWLKRHGWPQPGYQLLCFNCNSGRATNGGMCPHQNKKVEAA